MKARDKSRGHLLLPEPSDPVDEYWNEPDVQPKRNIKNSISPKERCKGNDHQDCKRRLNRAALPKYSCNLRRDQIFLFDGNDVRKDRKNGKDSCQVDRKQAGRVIAYLR